MANTFLKSIKTIAQSLINNAGYDKTRTGQIVGANTVTNTYSVKVDGNIYANVKTVNDFSYSVGDIVKVIIPCNQATQMYITGSALSDDSAGKKIATAQALGEQNAEDIEALEEQIDGKIETWVMMSAPSENWTTDELKAAHNDDLWYYNGVTTLTLTMTVEGVSTTVTILPAKTYQYQYDADEDTETWVLYNSSAESLFDFADGKSSIWYGALYKGTSTASGVHYNDETSYDSYSTGDFFYNTSTGVTYYYTSSSTWVQFTYDAYWVEEDDYLVDAYDGSTYKWDGSMWVIQTDFASPIRTITSQISTVVDELGNVYELYIATTYNDTSVIHTAVLTQNGIDITSDTTTESGSETPLYSNDMGWYVKTTDGLEYIGVGKSVTISKSALYYGQVVMVWWVRRQYANLLVKTSSSSDTYYNLLDYNGASFIARAEDSLFEDEEE